MQRNTENVAVRGIVASIEMMEMALLLLINGGDAENVGVKCYFNEDQKGNFCRKGDQCKIIGEGGENLSIRLYTHQLQMGKPGEN